MRPSHNDDSPYIPLLDDPGDFQGLGVIRCKRGRNPEDIGPRSFEPPADLIPVHAEMIIPGIEFEGALVLNRIIILEV